MDVSITGRFDKSLTGLTQGSDRRPGVAENLPLPDSSRVMVMAVYDPLREPLTCTQLVLREKATQGSPNRHPHTRALPMPRPQPE